MNSDKGFTLMELLIVIAIIGILAAAASTAYIGVMKKAARSEAYSNLESLRLLEEQFFAEYAEYAPRAPFPAVIAYNATIGVADNGIEDALSGFRPGTDLSYTYELRLNEQITNNMKNTTADPPTRAALTPCFVARARGILGTRVCPVAANCDEFVIDCNNIRNF